MIAAAVAVAGCGGGSSPPRTTTTRAASVAVTTPPKCKLSAKQRRVIARLKREIVQMHKLEAPLKTVHKHGPLKLELLLNRFLLSVGILPVDERGLLIRKAKSSVALCQDCFDAPRGDRAFPPDQIRRIPLPPRFLAGRPVAAFVTSRVPLGQHLSAGRCPERSAIAACPA